MNQYKLDWYLATQSVSNYVMNRIVAENDASYESRNPSPTELMIDNVMETAGRAVATWIVPTLLKHMAQNQIKGKLGIMGRVGGRVGLRAVPVLGTLMIVKDAYDLYDYLTDA